MVNLRKAVPFNLYPAMESETFLFYMLRYNYINDVLPLHSRGRNKENHVDLFQLTMKSYESPVKEIREYYGEPIAIYFLWCNFMAKWLLMPTVFALILYVIEFIVWDEKLQQLYNVGFSVGIAVWAVLLVKNWRRRCAEIDIEWDNYNLDTEKVSLRQQFQGDLVTDQITDRDTIYYSDNQRLMRYIESVIISFPYIFGALFVMIASLNMMGYVDDKEIYCMSFLADMAKPGGVFEKGSFLSSVPSVIMTVGMTIIGKLYEPTAEWTTERENHKTKQDHLNSVNIKKFAFNMTFYFSHLFYVAFEKMDLPGLRKELITLALVDEIRRIVSESALPAVIQNNGFHFDKKFDSIVEEELNEIAKPEYTFFEDYLEFVIQYGYVTLFAVAFPLGAAFNYIFFFFERRSDTFKIEKLCRRPISSSTSDIGIWDNIMVFMSYTSIFTNLFLFAFALNHDEILNSTNIVCVNSYFFIANEHLLIIIIVILTRVIPDKPKWVRTFLKRADFKLKRETIVRNAASKISTATSKIKGLAAFKN